MEKIVFVFLCLAAVAVILPMQQVIGAILNAGCDGDAGCTDICTGGFAGSGNCVNGNYCQCDNCPIRSGNNTFSLQDACLLDPICGAFCPLPTLDMNETGKAFFGHRCFLGSIRKQYCTCFCLPTDYKPYQDAILPGLG